MNAKPKVELSYTGAEPWLQRAQVPHLFQQLQFIGVEAVIAVDTAAVTEGVVTEVVDVEALVMVD